MEIVIIEGHGSIPAKYQYKVYQGDQEACLRRFRQQYPHFAPVTVFYITSLNQLWVPMSWERFGEAELKASKL